MLPSGGLEDKVIGGRRHGGGLNIICNGSTYYE
jgi:hypothetical protein